MHVYVCKNITNFIKKRADIQDQQNKRKHNPKGSITSINMTICVKGQNKIQDEIF